MQLEIFQVDAFSAVPFGGNPAAVIALEQWLPDDLLQRIAEENNLSETAYFVRNGEVFDLRWFTPTVEVDLCGHATLAAAWVLFEQLGERAEVLRFNTRSGELRVSRAADGRLAMDFPAKQPVAVDMPEGLLAALGLGAARAVYRSDDYVVMIEDASLLDALEPDFVALSAFDVRGIAVTAPGRGFDFVTCFRLKQACCMPGSSGAGFMLDYYASALAVVLLIIGDILELGIAGWGGRHGDFDKWQRNAGFPQVTLFIKLGVVSTIVVSVEKRLDGNLTVGVVRPVFQYELVPNTESGRVFPP